MPKAIVLAPGSSVA